MPKELETHIEEAVEVTVPIVEAEISWRNKFERLVLVDPLCSVVALSF